MSSEALKTPLETAQSWKANWGSWVLFVVLFYVVAGLHPFAQKGRAVLDISGGDSTNQLIWGVMAVLSLGFAVMHFDDARRLLVRSWPLLLALGWIAMTIMWAPYPDLSGRRIGILFTVSAVGVGLAMTCRSPVSFFRTMVLLTGVIMTLNVFGLVALPGHTVTESGVVGMHSHKNVAGQTTLVAYIVWFVAAVTTRDFRWRVVFAGGTLVWFGFLILTQSKTSLGIAVLTPFVMTAAYAVTRTQGLVRLCLIAMMVAGLALVWSIFLGLGITLEKFFLLVFRDLTFTGRTNLWEYLWGVISNKPLIGYGYGSFWHTGLRLSPIDYATGWSAVAGQAHNGYLDLIVKTGYIGLFFALICVGRSLYLAVQLASNPNIRGDELGAYTVAVALFCAFILLNFMESSYFRGFHFLSVQFLFLYFFVEQWSDRVSRGDRDVSDEN